MLAGHLNAASRLYTACPTTHVLLSLSQDNELDMLGDLLGDAMIAAMDGIELGELAVSPYSSTVLAYPGAPSHPRREALPLEMLCMR
jgi:hypothetical protein